MDKKSLINFVLDWAKLLLMALAIVVPIRLFLFQPFVVSGASMDPSFHDADYLIIDELSYKLKEPARQEVIVFKYPLNPSYKYIKRIIGLPGEKVEIKEGEIYIIKDGQTTKLEEPYLSEKTLKEWNRNVNFQLNSGKMNIL